MPRRRLLLRKRSIRQRTRCRRRPLWCPQPRSRLCERTRDWHRTSFKKKKTFFAVVAHPTHSRKSTQVTACLAIAYGPTPTVKQNKKRLCNKTKKVLLAGDESCCTIQLLRSAQSPLNKPSRLRIIGTLFQVIGCSILFFITGIIYSVFDSATP